MVERHHSAIEDPGITTGRHGAESLGGSGKTSRGIGCSGSRLFVRYTRFGVRNVALEVRRSERSEFQQIPHGFVLQENVECISRLICRNKLYGYVLRNYLLRRIGEFITRSARSPNDSLRLGFAEVMSQESSLLMMVK